MIGSQAWLAKRQGDLSQIDRWRLLTTIIGLRVKARFASNRMATRQLADVEITLPDSKLVAEALAECSECCSPAIFHHSCRTYFWAACLAKMHAVSFDPEELAIAALLHDLELGKVERRAATGCRCFAGAGAAVATTWLSERGVETVSIEAITQAIALHLNPGVPLSLGATPHLLNMGAMADVVGARTALISNAEQARVLELHPRNGFKREMIRHMRTETAFASRARAGFLMSIGFEKMIGRAPFDE
jgi:hypothetical protein